jgi:hypothetical protein
LLERPDAERAALIGKLHAETTGNGGWHGVLSRP